MRSDSLRKDTFNNFGNVIEIGDRPVIGRIISI